MRFSLRLNNDLSVDEYVALAKGAEEQGFDQFWVSNDLFLRSCLPILPIIAKATARIEVGTGILNPYTLNPAEIAMYAATMDEISGNRFNLGLAAGAADFLKWVGLEQSKPLTMMRDTVTAIRSALSGEHGAVEGRALQWSNEAYMRFNAPRITPIYIGAMGPNMLTLTGEIADGALPLLFPPEHFFQVLPFIKAGMAKRSPTLGQLDMATCIWVSLSEDRDEARRVLAQKVAYYGHAMSPMILEELGLSKEDFLPIENAIMVERNEQKAIDLVDDRMLRIGIVGGPSDVIERLEPIVDAGADHLSFGPPLGPDLREAVWLLGELIRHFRG